MMNGKDILIADDHVIVRRGLQFLLREHYPQVTIREAASMTELLRELSKTQPDLLILDLQLADRNSFGSIGQLRLMYPDLRILVFSMTSARVFKETILRSGVNGFLNKQCSDSELLETMKRLLHAPVTNTDPTPAFSASPFSALSTREINIMHELLTGRSAKEIALRLDLEATTVATYKRRLYDKLGATSVLDLQRMVNEHG